MTPGSTRAITVDLEGVVQGWCVVYHGCPDGVHSLVDLWPHGNLVPHWLFLTGLHDGPHQLCSAVGRILGRVPAGKVFQEAPKLLTMTRLDLCQRKTKDKSKHKEIKETLGMMK